MFATQSSRALKAFYVQPGRSVPHRSQASHFDTAIGTATAVGQQIHLSIGRGRTEKRYLGVLGDHFANTEGDRPGNLFLIDTGTNEMDISEAIGHLHRNRDGTMTVILNHHDEVAATTVHIR